MKKTLIFIFTVLMIISDSVRAAPPEDGEAYAETYADTQSLGLAILREGTAFVPLRAFAAALAPRYSVEWDAEKRTAWVRGENMELSAEEGAEYITANGRYLWLDKPGFIADGRMMLPVRTLAKAFGCQVSWDGANRRVLIDGRIRPIESGESFYDEDDLYWLSRIIYSEAGGECLKGQVAVGCVVLNRMAEDYWPDSVYEVIFDRRCGVQFAPTESGSIYRQPSDSALIAAKLALDGAETVGDSKFFFNAAVATSSWIAENRDYVTTIGAHSFYA
ncbi:MAG: cell wall hydrolase [Oscillospiraceae bacterium]|nr:cell wall hydrolase [Oscillospiraceae bacterium]